MVDKADSKSVTRKGVWVQVPPSAPDFLNKPNQNSQKESIITTTEMRNIVDRVNKSKITSHVATVSSTTQKST